jgi:hypothetical protein
MRNLNWMRVLVLALVFGFLGILLRWIFGDLRTSWLIVAPFGALSWALAMEWFVFSSKAKPAASRD